MSKFGQHSFDLGAWGFQKSDPSEHVPEPMTVKPEYMLKGELQQKGYHVEELNDGFHWVTAGQYDAAFVTTGQGVIAIDAPPMLGENMLAAIEEVTDEPVTHVVYSHYHSDHIGAASMFGADVKIIGHELTREYLERWPDPQRPLPTETFSDKATLEVGGVTLELAHKGVNHSPDNIFIYAPRQRILTAIDIVSPGWSTFFHCDASENIPGWMDAHDQILEYDFDALVGGHVTRYGTRADVEASREYNNDILQASYDMLDGYFNVDTFFIEAGFEHLWTVAENQFNAMANEVTRTVLNKVSSNGQRWADRLAGATNMTKYHAWSIMESIRLHRSHDGYQKRGPQIGASAIGEGGYIY
jgi:glyoxylase-like metal-dependent hydrolase (beta-lactamase superfamily II)